MIQILFQTALITMATIVFAGLVKDFAEITKDALKKDKQTNN